MLPPLLTLCARLSSDEIQPGLLREAVAGCHDWPAVLVAAEAHRLAPLLYHHLHQDVHQDAFRTMPESMRRMLTVQYLRHRRSNLIRLAVLRTILHTYAEERIPVLLLKGSALCRLLYPDPALRPMSDLDLLVKPQDGSRAQQLLTRLGFHAPLPPPHWRHHHLPVASKVQDGIVVMVEVHQDVFHQMVGASLTWKTLAFPPCPVPFGEWTAETLGYEDMLWHLCHHMVQQPMVRQPQPFIASVDILEFAKRFETVIDWEFIRQHSPFVLNTLALLSLVVPLPERLRQHLDLDVRNIPSGIGVIYEGWPFQSTRRAWKQPRRMLQLLHKTFRPSAWWLRLFYGLHDDQSVAFCRYVTHPAYIARIAKRKFRI